MTVLSEQQMLDTTRAGRLVGRTQDAVRNAIRDKTLSATNIGGRWYVDHEALLDWHRTTKRLDRVGSRPWEGVASLLVEYGPSTALELSELCGLHVGNVRKYLAILARQGRALQSNGQWALTADEHHGAA